MCLFSEILKFDSYLVELSFEIRLPYSIWYHLRQVIVSLAYIFITFCFITNKVSLINNIIMFHLYKYV